MITINPFAELSAYIPPLVMQGYVVLMVLLVVGGTILDMLHKKSAQYFFENSKRAQKSATRTLDSGTKASLALKTVANEVLTSSEFANPKRRLSHLFTMYGFVIFVVTTAIMIFAYPTKDVATPALLPLLWHLGALMLCIGGYWFWFFIRVDLNSEGNPWYRLVRADIFIVSLLATATLALIWSFLQSSGSLFAADLFFIFFILAATVLFGTVFWSKFAHMFFKPAAAYQKRVIKADGSRENLPAIYDLTDPAVHAKYPDVPEYMGKNPPNMGLGIKREAPNHF
ncbi:MAG: hypothetical protein ACFCUJ_13485 [Thiotrichales bacterium]